MNAPNGFPGIKSIDQHHVSREPVDVERAGFETLAADNRAALERYMAAGERARRIRENGDELANALASCASILRLIGARPLVAASMPATIRAELERADALLARINGPNRG